MISRIKSRLERVITMSFFALWHPEDVILYWPRLSLHPPPLVPFRLVDCQPDSRQHLYQVALGYFINKYSISICVQLSF